LAPSFILATDLQPDELAWSAAIQQAQTVAAECAKILGFEPAIRVASIPGYPGEIVRGRSLPEVIAEQAVASEIFVLPVALDFNLWQKEAIGQILAEQRRNYPDVSLHHDDVDAGHPLLVQCLADQALRVLTAAPQRAGILVVASGHGDPCAAISVVYFGSR
jgi:sirohydrochlorin ferrochelatase